jgi:hypothetical protein
LWPIATGRPPLGSGGLQSLIGTIWRDRGVAVHEIAEAEARITTVFVYRHDALISSALKEFLKFSREDASGGISN